MNEANTKKLVDCFPRIFPQPFYFSCGNGWFDLLNNVCKDIDAECERLCLPAEKWVTASEVKEKYGTLRIYVDSYQGSKLIATIIEAAEKRSSGVCEDCGLPGITREGNLVHTTCDTCDTLSNKQKA